ncbi:hypothetical protein COLO4_14743 [Corchorus olitorius]|uniref:Uncharacterized protein n=1 Tax=Corchorus olitorius TaxID=93759 RepID=A0A1R3JQY0_9ROSI|nr:hypothetical protein COLO4_14743 [Corchorus olitorius]
MLTFGPMGGKEANKKSATSQSSTKGSTVAPRPPSSHARRNDVSSSVNSSNQSAKVSSKPPAAPIPAYDE